LHSRYLNWRRDVGCQKREDRSAARLCNAHAREPDFELHSSPLLRIACCVCLVSKVVPASTHSDRSTPRYSSISPGLPLFRCLVACLARSLFSTRRAPRVDTSWLCPSHVANMQSPLDLVISNRSLVFVSCPEILFRATTAPVLESETVHDSLCKCLSAAWCASAVHQPSSLCTTRWL
jgi:hypothetical protein